MTFDTLRALVALPRGFPMKMWKILLFPKGQVEAKEEEEGNKICGTRCNRPSSNSFFYGSPKDKRYSWYCLCYYWCCCCCTDHLLPL